MDDELTYYNAPYPTIGDLIKNKNYDYVSYRLQVPEMDEYGVFAGCFKVDNGKITSLDGDIYSYDKRVIASEEWSNLEENVERGLTIIV